jgi:hypothetical protein
MQGIPYLDKSKITDSQWIRLGESAFRILQSIKNTKEGRKMLREEIKLMRQEKAERKNRSC